MQASETSAELAASVIRVLAARLLVRLDGESVAVLSVLCSRRSRTTRRIPVCPDSVRADPCTVLENGHGRLRAQAPLGRCDLRPRTSGDVFAIRLLEAAVIRFDGEQVTRVVPLTKIIARSARERGQGWRPVHSGTVSHGLVAQAVEHPALDGEDGDRNLPGPPSSISR